MPETNIGFGEAGQGDQKHGGGGERYLEKKFPQKERL